MENLPIYISTIFILTTIVTVGLLIKAGSNLKNTVLLLSGWLVFQAFLGLSGFYLVTDTIPPRFILLISIPILAIIIIFNTKQGKEYLNALDPGTLTLLHVIRIPVELVLFWLFLNKGVPELMTFEGRNFDILSGITAPFIYYFGYRKNFLSKNVLLIWNVVCLGLLFNIVTNAILSSPVPFQQFAFDQPNVAILYFPFVWLPCCVVPIVLFAHLVSIRKLLMQQ
ncbi:MAG: hypothetical protein SFY32_10545 [Bacteroidota bacterium]|nr:hypothetical protein [Bacteroidota bacterium]